MTTEREVRDAADALVADFGAGRVEEYFARLAPEATFVFHTAPARLGSRAAYRELWGRWVAEDGLLVLERASRDPAPQWPPGVTDRWERRYGETTLYLATKGR